MTEEVKSPKKSKAPLYCLITVLIVGIVLSCITSLYTAQAVHIMQKQEETKTATQEDGVKIMDQYEIVSTLSISDAYRSGDTSKLDAKQKETLDMASALLSELTADAMSDYEKELAVYQWMSSKLNYDTGVLTVIPKTQADSSNPYGVLKYHTAICVGYATTFRLLMQMMNIDCMVVHNTDRPHSWDLVKLDGEWYHTDVYSDQGNTNYANFNMNDEMCGREHDWDRDFFPAAAGIQYNYGYQNKVAIDDLYQLPAMVKQAMDHKEGCIFAGFSSITEVNAQIAEALLTGVQDCMSASDDYSRLWMNWNWIGTPDGGYVLGIYLSGYNQDGMQSNDIPQEARDKISTTLTHVFGASPTWSAIAEQETADNQGKGSASGVSSDVRNAEGT